MDPILDETSLVPCPLRPPAQRIVALASVLTTLDALGAPRVLRSVRDASDRDLGGGRGLRGWCFDAETPRDAGRFIAARLAAQPFIDGEGGLFASAEGDRIVEARTAEGVVAGVGLAAMTDGVVAVVTREARPVGGARTVEIVFLDEDGERRESVDVPTYALASEVERDRDALVRRVEATLRDGRALLRRASEVFPRLRLGPRAEEQIAVLNGAEPTFHQLVRHLRALDAGAARWAAGSPFEPVAVTYSVESKATLEHGDFGPMRDFATPSGFEHERWSLHTKLTGGSGARLYFRPVRSGDEGLVLVGYFGAHLPTTRFRT